MDLGRIMPLSRENALEEYGKMGFLVRLSGDGSLAYPSAARLDGQIAPVSKRLQQIGTQLCEMRENRLPIPENVLRLADPLWWEHSARLFLDNGYRSAYESVKPPLEMLADAKGRRIFSSFMRSPDYRKSLCEASRHGISRPFSRSGRTDGLVEKRCSSLLSEREQLLKKLRCLTAVRALAK